MTGASTGAHSVELASVSWPPEVYARGQRRGVRKATSVTDGFQPQGSLPGSTDQV